MAWGSVDVSQKRLEFVVRAAGRREAMRGLCREYGISPETGYKWLQRYQETGRLDAVREHSRRPLHQPTKTAPAIEARVVELRRQYPDWGAKKLRRLLLAEGVDLPVITIHRVLLRHELIAPEDRRRPAIHRFERDQPNALWQMDYKGVPQELSSKLALLGILDDHSRYLAALAVLPSTAAKPLLELLPRVFEECGVPEAMLVDHGTPWWNAQAAWGLTRVSLWLVKQNIQLIHSAVRHPQTQGKIEASNRALQRQLRYRGWPEQLADWPPWAARFRQEWNHVRPHEALALATPASRWGASSRKFQPHVPAAEYEDGALVCRIHPHGQFRVHGRDFSGPAALAGEDVAISHFREDRYLVTYRRTLIREVDLRTGQSWPLPFQPYRDLFADSDPDLL